MACFGYSPTQLFFTSSGLLRPLRTVRPVSRCPRHWWRALVSDGVCAEPVDEGVYLPHVGGEHGEVGVGDFPWHLLPGRMTGVVPQVSHHGEDATEGHIQVILHVARQPRLEVAL